MPTFTSSDNPTDEEMLIAARVSLKKAMLSQSHSSGDRSMSNQPISQLMEAVRFWEERVNIAAYGETGGGIAQVVFTDPS